MGDPEEERGERGDPGKRRRGAVPGDGRGVVQGYQRGLGPRQVPIAAGTPSPQSCQWRQSEPRTQCPDRKCARETGVLLRLILHCLHEPRFLLTTDLCVNRANHSTNLQELPGPFHTRCVVRCVPEATKAALVDVFADATQRASDANPQSPKLTQGVFHTECVVLCGKSTRSRDGH